MLNKIKIHRLMLDIIGCQFDVVLVDDLKDTVKQKRLEDQMNFTLKSEDFDSVGFRNSEAVIRAGDATITIKHLHGCYGLIECKTGWFPRMYKIVRAEPKEEFICPSDCKWTSSMTYCRKCTTKNYLYEMKEE